MGKNRSLVASCLIVRRYVGSVNSYSHLMSQTELFGTGSTYLQFLLEIKMKLVEILIVVGYKIGFLLFEFLRLSRARWGT